jgi:hypothetical protein
MKQSYQGVEMMTKLMILPQQQHIQLSIGMNVMKTI